MKKELVVSRRWWTFSLPLKAQCFLLCLAVLTTLAPLSPSRAYILQSSSCMPYQLRFDPGAYPLVFLPNTQNNMIRFRVVNYQNPYGQIGTITWMQIWVDSIPLTTVIDNSTHSGYALWDTTGVLNPSAHTTSAMAEVVTSFAGGSVTTLLNSLDPLPPNPIPSCPPPAGMGHVDDITVADFGIDRAAQRNIDPPQMRRTKAGVIDGYDYPAGYIKGSIPTVKFGLDVSNLNNLQAYHRFQIWFAGENYYFESLVQALQGGLNNSVTCPQLPTYVYAHHFRIVIRIWFWFPNDQVWVPYSSWEYNPVSAPPALDWTNDWYAVFDDPNVTSFPPYKVGGADRTVPWYQIIANALNHVTTSGADQTVTQDSVAMTNLTTDLYVWPNRPNGPGSSSYSLVWCTPLCLPSVRECNCLHPLGHETVNQW